jgi:hypothetical protein
VGQPTRAGERNFDEIEALEEVLRREEYTIYAKNKENICNGGKCSRCTCDAWLW